MRRASRLRHFAWMTLLLSLAAPAGLAETDHPARPEIDLDPVEGGYLVTARVTGQDLAGIDATLVLTKTGKAGTVSLRQARHLGAEAVAPQLVGSSRLSVEPGATLAVELWLERDGQELARITAAADGMSAPDAN